MIQPLTKGRRCRICGKGPIRGYSIARRGQAKKKGGVGKKTTGRTKRSFKPNLQRMRAWIEGRVEWVKVCTSCLHAGKIRKPIRA